MVRQLRWGSESRPGPGSSESERRAYATRELQRSLVQVEAVHARMERLRQRGDGPGEVEDVYEATRLALWSLRRIVEQLRKDAG
jgi:hypothetical protein